MKRTALTIISGLLLLNGYSQHNVYKASTIPRELKINSYSVKREERITFEVKAIGKAVYKVHRVLTVLNERGKKELEFHEFSDQFRSLENVSIRLFDMQGLPLKQYRRSDLSKQISGEGLVPDGNIYIIELVTPTYPVTMQVDYEIKYNGLLNYPDFEVQLPEQAVEDAVFVATVPVELDLRFKGENTDLTPVTTNNGKIKTYTWKVSKLPAPEYEVGSVSYESRYPHILLSPNKFELDGYAGDLTTWQNFGKWYGSLARKANNLKAERKFFFQNLVKDLPNDKEKTRSIYNYLQADFRYVSIQLGIGGFKPFDAHFVDTKKYGDCKALSNYMQACLSAVGIKSYQALINAGYNKEAVDPSFPYNGFNHVIICVPLQNDTIWLECTSNTSEFGSLGNFTENRNALLITADGGKLVPTPRSRAFQNTFSSNTIIDLKGDGSGAVHIKLHTTGEYRQQVMNYISNQKKDDQKRFLINYIGYLPPDEFEINNDRPDKRTVTTMTMRINKIPEFTAGKKMFLNPRIYKIWSEPLPTAEHRTQDFYFEHPFIKTDTTIYQLPKGFGMETLPAAKQLTFEYGNFNASCVFDAGKNCILSVARLELNEYKIPADKFLAAKKFFDEVWREFTEKIVIKTL